jgi:hypothetical protein
MATLEERMRDNSFLAAAVMNRSMPNREVARTFDIDESVIRRWRQRNIVAPEPMERISEPGPIGQTVQWFPGLDLSRDRGEARTLPVPVTEGVTLEDKELLESVGADPEKWEVTCRKESRWQNAGGEWLSAHKLELGRRGAQSGDLSVDQISEILKDYEGRDGLARWDSGEHHANGIFVVPIADLQAGKIDGGGTAALVDRFGRIVQEIREKIEAAGGADLIVIPVLGDCIEGLVSQGGKLVARLDISITEQVRVYRRLLTHIVAELSPYAARVIVPVLPGNHDETYRIVQQPVTDSWAIEGASAVADAMADNPKYKHVGFIFPEDEELVITLNVGGQDKPFVLGFTHGHLAKAPNSFEAWWGKQSFGKQQAGLADMMFTGHFHHLRVEQMGSNRTWIQAPPLDGGSNWFRRADGSDVPAGMISLWVTPGQGIGWEGLTVHTGE